MIKITKSEFNMLVSKHGLNEAITIVRNKLGKAYTNLIIKFDSNDELIITKLKKNWTKNESPYRQNVQQKREHRKNSKKPQK